MAPRRKRCIAPGEALSAAALRRRRRRIESCYRDLFDELVRQARFKHELPWEDARDVVQDAFMVAMAKMGDVGDPRAWLMAVVDNLAANARSTRKNRAALQARWGIPGRDAGWARGLR